MKIGNEFTNTVINTINFQTGTEFSIGEMIKELIDTAEGGITIPIINWSIIAICIVCGIYYYLSSFNWNICYVYISNRYTSNKNCFGICLCTDSTCDWNLGRR